MNRVCVLAGRMDVATLIETVVTVRAGCVEMTVVGCVDVTSRVYVTSRVDAG